MPQDSWAQFEIKKSLWHSQPNQWPQIGSIHKSQKGKTSPRKNRKGSRVDGGVRVFFFWRSSSSYWRVAQVLSLEEKMDFPERCKMSNQAQVSSLEFKSAKNLELTWNLVSPPPAHYSTPEWDHKGPWNKNIWYDIIFYMRSMRSVWDLCPLKKNMFDMRYCRGHFYMSFLQEVNICKHNLCLR